MRLFTPLVKSRLLAAIPSLLNGVLEQLVTAVSTHHSEPMFYQHYRTSSTYNHRNTYILNWRTLAAVYRESFMYTKN